MSLAPPVETSLPVGLKVRRIGGDITGHGGRRCG